jgi:AcrR family transcriptional regulator
MERQRRTQAARSRATREQIVQAAVTVFALKGYAAASMDDICLAAGCSKGGLYHHFPAKPAVLAAVVERMSSQGLLSPFAGAPLQPDAAGRILVEIWAAAARDADLREQIQTLMARTDGAGYGGIAPLLRIGALIQLLALTDEPDARAAARRLGLERAA